MRVCDVCFVTVTAPTKSPTTDKDEQIRLMNQALVQLGLTKSTT